MHLLNRKAIKKVVRRTASWQLFSCNSSASDGICSKRLPLYYVDIPYERTSEISLS